jgi:hypothetical protein
MTVIRAFLAVILLVGFYVVGLGGVMVLGWLSLWLWWTAAGQIAHDVSYAMLVLAFGLAAALWRVMRVRPTPPPGAPLTEEQAPQLWSLVRELAVAVGTRPPDEIRLDATVNAGIWEDAGLVGLRPVRVAGREAMRRALGDLPRLSTAWEAYGGSPVAIGWPSPSVPSWGSTSDFRTPAAETSCWPWETPPPGSDGAEPGGVGLVDCVSVFGGQVAAQGGQGACQ